MNKKQYDSTPEPIESRFKRWMYQAKILEGVATLSDGTRYAVDSISSTWRRLTKKSYPQRERRRLMGKLRRKHFKMTRSQFDRTHQNSQVPKGE